MTTETDSKPSGFRRFKQVLFGAPRSPHDRGVFHQLSLIAFFAWVGLGADGLSSTCYGPSEAFRALGTHVHLSIFVALATAVTIFVLSASESQVMELFPAGGGGYVVASKLLNPTAGMVAGSALLIDFMLTIAISIASGTDAIFSFFPRAWQPYKLPFAVGGILLLTVMNLRGVKESIVPLIPIFMVFVLTHALAILYGIFAHGRDLPGLAVETTREVGGTYRELGMVGLLLLVLRAYGMGAGTYTGIEAVSSSMTIMREPRVQTAKKTLRYMSVSLAVFATGLFIAYLLYDVQPAPGKTLNAVFLEGVTASWPASLGTAFLLLTLASETAILFIAAQAGFLSGPRVLASMAVDRWVPTRFASLSDRLVTHNGILLMSTGALLTVVFTGGSVGFLVVLYSINVFITFALSQAGMVRHAWAKRKDPDPVWGRRLRTNAAALSLTVFILACMVILKFHEGGWITILVTGGMIAVVRAVRAYYNRTGEHLKRLDGLVEAADLSDLAESEERPAARLDPTAKTAVVLVNGFNGMGLHTLFAVIRVFGDTFKNFVFISVGMIDAGNFKGADEIQHLRHYVQAQLDRYVNFMRRRGYYAEGRYELGIDALEEIDKMAPDVIRKFPKSVFFGGQLAFGDDTLYSRWLHNYLVMAAQTRLHNRGIPFIILPIRVQSGAR
jgi:amino acid transporter